MTKKRFRKLLRAHFTAFYLQNREDLRGWIAWAYKTASKSTTATDHAAALDAIKKALPLN